MLNRVLNLLADREQELFTLLEKLVLVQSGTRNKQGVDQVGRMIEEYLADLPLNCRRVKEKDFGDHLVFTTPAAAHEKYILITGHMDTVFPEDTDFNWYREDSEKIYGPGVIDMKGGLVVTMAAVRVLAEVGRLSQIPLVLVINSDEEIGSPSSIPLIEELARGACCGLVTECGGMEGQVVTGRRGKTGYRLEVQGRAGHAAFAEKEKASAILELCRLVDEIENFNDPQNGLVVNVGVIRGGMGQNSVAEHAEALIDSRFPTAEQGERLQQKMEQLVAFSRTPGTSSRISFTNRRPVMVQSDGNNKLYGLIRQQAEKLGIRISDEVRLGGSDASNIAGQGIPVVDGLGPIGEHDHSDREYMLKDSLLKRSRLLAASILELDRLNYSVVEE